jgi:hypothetical protein
MKNCKLVFDWFYLKLIYFIIFIILQQGYESFILSHLDFGPG